MGGRACSVLFMDFKAIGALAPLWFVGLAAMLVTAVFDRGAATAIGVPLLAWAALFIYEYMKEVRRQEDVDRQRRDDTE